MDLTRVLAIQRFPRGLLDMLAMRGPGETPHTLASSIAGTIDLTKLYLADSNRTVIATQTPPANDGYVNPAAATVPPGEIWLVNAISAVSGNLPAGTNAQAICAYNRRAAAGVMVFGNNATAAAGADLVCGQVFDPFSLILYPSDGFGVQMHSGTYGGGAPLWTLTCDYYRLLI